MSTDLPRYQLVELDESVGCMYQLLSHIYEASMITIFYVSVFHPQSVQRLAANTVLDQIVMQACISDASCLGLSGTESVPAFGSRDHVGFDQSAAPLWRWTFSVMKRD